MPGRGDFVEVENPAFLGLRPLLEKVLEQAGPDRRWCKAMFLPGTSSRRFGNDHRRRGDIRTLRLLDGIPGTRVVVSAGRSSFFWPEGTDRPPNHDHNVFVV